MINLANVTNTYQGDQGCACGCRGTYATEGRALALRVAKINKALDSGPALEEVIIDYYPDEKIYEWVAPNGKVTRVYEAKA